MDSVVTLVTDLRAPVLYALILAVVFAETAVLLGMFLPGETAAIVAGVLAGQQHLSLEAVIPLVAAAAVAGDTTGYLLGRRFGPAVLEGRLLRRRRDQVEHASATLRRHGALVIVGSRFLPFLRTVTPGAAGVSGVPYLTFFPASVAGCLLWGIGCPLLGYLAADSYHRIEELVGNTGLVVLAVLLLGGWAVRARRRRRASRAARVTTTVEAAPETGATAVEQGRLPVQRRSPTGSARLDPAAPPEPPEPPARTSGPPARTSGPGPAAPDPGDTTDPADPAGPPGPAANGAPVGVVRPRRRTDRRRP